jgi:hypothetical protein
MMTPALIARMQAELAAALPLWGLPSGSTLASLSHSENSFSLFEAAIALVELISMGPRAPTALLTNIAANGATAFLVILAMTFGLILPRILLEDRS